MTNAVGQYINVSLYKAIDKIKIFQGDLVAFDGETLTIDYLDKTRHKTVEIPYQTVAKARWQSNSKTLSVNKERMPVLAFRG